MNELEIRTLTERFFNGETTLAEERRLYQLYSEAETLPADLEELREMMADLGVGLLLLQEGAGGGFLLPPPFFSSSRWAQCGTATSRRMSAWLMSMGSVSPTGSW